MGERMYMLAILSCVLAICIVYSQCIFMCFYGAYDKHKNAGHVLSRARALSCSLAHAHAYSHCFPLPASLSRKCVLFSPSLPTFLPPSIPPFLALFHWRPSLSYSQPPSPASIQSLSLVLARCIPPPRANFRAIRRIQGYLPDAMMLSFFFQS